MGTEILKKYADIKRQINALEEVAKLMVPEVMAEIEKTGEKKAATDFGTFSVAVRKTYTYSEKVESMEEKLKLTKLKEVEQGIAQAKENPYLIYKDVAPKE